MNSKGMSGDANGSRLSHDRPIQQPDEDRLGFAPLARRLADGLLAQASKDGFVVGIEGRWGSGKSSLLNLTAKALLNLPVASRPVLVEFKPWLIGSRDELLSSMFSQLSSEIEALEIESGTTTTRDKRLRTEIISHIQSYAAKAEKFGGILSAIPGSGVAGAVLKSIGAALKGKKSGPTLLQLKQILDDSLDTLERRIVITIDDVDRLEPAEVIELLRLIRSVADFRNVIYVLCYDGDIISRSIEAAIHIDNGYSYLEKIVQVTVAVPIPEPFHLRRWFQFELDKMYCGTDIEAGERLASVVDQEGGRRLTTPRAVVRTLNALHLLTPSLGDQIDFPDMVWLQLIKIGNNKFYRWIEDYCAECAAISGWRASVGSDQRRRSFKNLEKILNEDSVEFSEYRFILSEHLFGIELFESDEEKGKIPIYGEIGRAELERAIQGRRLASPDHYRFYFALNQPQLAPSALDYERLLDAAATSSTDVAETFIEWSGLRDPAFGTKMEVALDRFRHKNASLSVTQAEHIFLGLAECMDEVGLISGANFFGRPSAWLEAQRCIPKLRSAMGEMVVARAITQAFGRGKSLGWLTDLLRHETFSHGRYGDRKEPPSEWLFTEAELDTVVQRLIERYRVMSIEDFFALPQPLSALYAWAQAGDPTEPKHLVQDAAIDDAGLVRVLEAMTGRVRSSTGTYLTLSRTNIGSFLDYDTTRRRISDLSENKNSELQDRSAMLLKYFEAGEAF